MMTQKEISKFKFIVSSDLNKFAYDLEQSSDVTVFIQIFSSILIKIFDKNMNQIFEFCFVIDTDSNETGNYLEFSKKFKAFKQQAEKLL